MIAEPELSSVAEVTHAEGLEETRWEVADALQFMSVYAVKQGVRWDVLAELRGRRR